MQKMRFDKIQPKITIYPLGGGISDVIICTNEQIVESTDEATGEKETAYEYDGNSFRTCKEIAEDMINADLEYYLEYPGDTAPTAEMIEYANAAIDEYTLQLLEGGIL